ncbi:SMP-30/gluconolactonase/LRE family protein [Spirosoma sp. KCTC 42546]|uniref:SMP-30/gluconolactonase/LRE family protein n=1 Tax=Spirosoma sp. KCTC 42546 TaxID=2520506 RepID=UPI001159B21B|nr:SMP-30/gluconolactonase/LRE family protein [Spirosoma sp. KCTC 42546]QDK78515.1 SMP-30/gluconolactonase/LRE family protein [Spirosoma sp. KCTC 42546]
MNLKSLLLSGWLAFVLRPAIAQTTPFPTIGQIVKADARLDKLVPPDAKIEVLASGFDWTEGPIWVKNEAFLLFSDVPKNTIFKWTDKEGVTPFLKPSGYTGLGPYSDEPGSNGLTIDRQGRLIACEHGDRRVTAMSLTGGGGKRTLADNYNGKRFNSPNDVVAHSSGSYYFTDPPYGMPKKEKDPGRETDGWGVYRIAPERAGVPGTVSIVVGDLTRPNGIALSPDEKILFVAQSDPMRPVVMAYPLQPDGSVGKGRIVFGPEQMKKQNLDGGFDGMKVDRDGNLWVTGGGGVLVLAPTQGMGPYDFLGHLKIGGATANCAWGDDGSTLYITADMYLCRIRTFAKGW